MSEDKRLEIILEAREYADRIKLASDDHFFLSIETHYWGSLADAARVRDLLKEVSDLIHSEGEYAP